MISKKEKAFADLVIIGYSASEAYLLLFQTKAKGGSINTLASRVWKSPKVQEYVHHQQNKLIAKLSNETEQVEEQTLKSSEVEMRTQGDILTEINQIINEVKEPKIKGQLLMKLSDLQKRENPNDIIKDKVVFYLPLTCYDCKYYQEKQEQRKRERLAQLRKQKEEVSLNKNEDGQCI